MRDLLHSLVIALSAGVPLRLFDQHLTVETQGLLFVNTISNALLLALVVIALRRQFRR